VSRRVRIAAAQWPIERVASIAAWRTKLEAWLAQAAAERSQLAVVPEYASMELTALLSDDVRADLHGQLHALQSMLTPYREAYVAAARRHGMTIVGGSFPEEVGGAFINRARVFGPGGGEVVVDKLQMTRFEAEDWGVAPGDGQVVVETDWGRFGVAICYDSEFPLIARRLRQAGAELLVVPSCTEATAGYFRVRVACQARALENQLAVIQAPTVGDAPWSPAVDTNVGAAAVYVPPDRGLPDDGVVAMGERNVAQWLHAELDLDAIAAVRQAGAVRVDRDWDLPAHVGGEVRRERA
jgi:predicted amidohydrolase